MATWNDQIPERQDRILQIIYESVAHHVGLHQQSFIGSARPVANPHKGDLDDLTESVGQTGSVSQTGSVGHAGVQSEVWDDNQVVNKVNLDVNVVIDRDNIAQSETLVNIQDNAQVNIQDNDLGVTLANAVPVNDWIDYHVNNQSDN